MPNKMLIDATHPEETRVVVLRGNRVEEFDFESANRKQLRGNIYLAKVTRVEPSLQAAFVDYGGNRHGFLAFSEIHPDYYQIPVADRQALIDEEERAARAADAEVERRAASRHGRHRAAERPREEVRSEPIDSPEETAAMAAGSEVMAPEAGSLEEQPAPEETPPAEVAVEEPAHAGATAETPIELSQLESTSAAEPIPGVSSEPGPDSAENGEPGAATEVIMSAQPEGGDAPAGGNITEINGGSGTEEEIVESVGGSDAMEEVPERAPRTRRQYKIQEVIKRRQVMLVQVVKEERGTKGAALTTYLSLAGRYSVLMPNTARGGGISRKVTNPEDRRRMKEVAQDLEVPEGMGVILRTAGASRTKTEIKRDFEYLLRLWETVRDLTLKSTAPTLVYEEGSLVKRSIRDLYNKDIDEIQVAGEEAYREAKEFMRMLMPSHGKNVQLYQDTLPIFTRHGIESQLDAMFQPVVQLRSGGYVVLNQAEALVAIDVNSGRATREHHIEDTALKTNLEAAEEIARQLRLRDLAGLIVIDFIDMDEKRNNRSVERRLKECLKHDRARIQVGHISHFGLLEMSRQRIRSSVLESSTDKCPHCGGTGHVRSVSSVSLQLLRSLEEMLLKSATHNVIVRTRSEIALYLLNHKRAHLRALEERFRILIMVNADATVAGQLSYVIEKGEQVHSPEQAKAIASQPVTVAPAVVEDEEDYEGEEDEDEEVQEDMPAAGQVDEARAEGDGVRRRRRRRRGRRGRGREEGGMPAPDQFGAAPAQDEFAGEEETESGPVEAGTQTGGQSGEAQQDGERRRRRRGRRGGRRNRRGRDEGRQPSDAVAGYEAELSMPDADARSYVEPVLEQREAEALQHRQDDVAQVQRHEEPAHERRPEQPPASAAPEPREPEAPRRRSSVREPAPAGLSDEAALPAPPQVPPTPSQPVVSSSEESEDADRPRRSGWWSKRALGKG